MEEQKRVALIDADSLTYIVAWNHKDSLPSLVEQSCDSIVEAILKNTQATHYLGTFSSTENFRHREYLVAPYKGNRPPKPEWVKEWEMVIKDHLAKKWGFIIPDNLEADDVVASLSFWNDGNTYIICSPDKDMKQCQGLHFNYSDLSTASVIEVDDKAAQRNFWTQILTGDTTDNIKGVPGIGPAKVQKMFENVESEIDYYMAVIDAFKLYYGEYYGSIIYQETLNAIQLMGPTHTHWQQHKDYLTQLKEKGFYPVPVIDPNNTPEI